MSLPIKHLWLSQILIQRRNIKKQNEHCVWHTLYKFVLLYKEIFFLCSIKCCWILNHFLILKHTLYKFVLWLCMCMHLLITSSLLKCTVWLIPFCFNFLSNWLFPLIETIHSFLIYCQVPRESLLFVIPAFVGVVSWEGEGAPFNESDQSITHQVCGAKMIWCLACLNYCFCILKCNID